MPARTPAIRDPAERGLMHRDAQPEGWWPELPPLVRGYVDRVLDTEAPTPRVVRIAQTGEMWRKPGGRALRFTAVEQFAVAEVEFSWRARFPLLPPLSLSIVDRYSGDDGSLEGRVLGIRVIRQTGPELAVGEAMRYLAELPWVPHAILANRQLEWSQLDDQLVEVATPVGATRAVVRLEFDEGGDIVGARAQARPALEGKTVVARPWAGSFGDYELVGGVRVPTRGEVRWQLPAGPFTYWRGTLTALELDPAG